MPPVKYRLAHEIEETLLAEVDGGETTGFQPSIVDGVLRFLHRWAIVTA